MSAMMFSADDHVDLGYLPADLWTERLPGQLRERGPRVVERDTQELWVCDGQVWGDWRRGRWYEDPKRHKVALDRIPFDTNPTSRPTTPQLRIEDMARDGVEASVLFPPIFGMRTPDRELAQAIVSTYNDWVADFGRAAPNNFVPVAQMFPDDPEASTRELCRAAEAGFKQVHFLVGTVSMAMYQPAWDRFWDAAEESGVIVSYHAGGVSATGGFSAVTLGGAEGGRPPAFNMGVGNGGTMFFEPFVGLFAFGVLERHPRLRFVLGESGTGWIPYVVQELDYRFEAAQARAGANYVLKRRPSDIFKAQVWATYQEDRVGLALVDFFGEGHMMWASDYPHPDSTWPRSQEVVADETTNLSAEVKQGIIRDNAKALYRL